jgi:hypothetical protein
LVPVVPGRSPAMFLLLLFSVQEIYTLPWMLRVWYMKGYYCQNITVIIDFMAESVIDYCIYRSNL